MTNIYRNDNMLKGNGNWKRTYIIEGILGLNNSHNKRKELCKKFGMKMEMYNKIKKIAQKGYDAGKNITTIFEDCLYEGIYIPEENLQKIMEAEIK